MNGWLKRLPRYRLKRLHLLLLAALGLAISAAWVVYSYYGDSDESSTTAVNDKNTVGAAEGEDVPSGFDKTQYSVDDPSSLWAVVNKGRALPSNYRPDGLRSPNIALRYKSGSTEMLLRPEAAAAMEAMAADAAANAGLKLLLASGYRPYSMQTSIYARHVRDHGQAQADRVSARPGHSEHQTGLSADVAPASRVCEIAKCFADTAEGKWVAQNAYKHGFIIRYPSGSEKLTGYDYEPWHVRFVGVDLANAQHQSGQTLEQFFNLPANSTYPSDIYRLKAD